MQQFRRSEARLLQEHEDGRLTVRCMTKRRPFTYNQLLYQPSCDVTLD